MQSLLNYSILTAHEIRKGVEVTTELVRIYIYIYFRNIKRFVSVCRKNISNWSGLILNP